MADFSQQQIQGPGYVAPPQQAVAPAPSAIQTVASSGIMNSIGNIFSGISHGAQVAEKKEAETTKNKILSEYAQKVTALNSAVEQGQKSMVVAQREQRALYSKVVANFPQVTEDLTAFNSKLLSSEGLGDVLAKGTAVEQQIQTDTKAATAAGFIQPNMSPQEQESGLNSYRQQQHQLNQMDFYSKQLEIQSKKASIAAQQENMAYTRVQRANALEDLNIKRNKQRLQSAVSDINTNYFSKSMGEMDEVQRQVETGKMSQEQALASLDKLANDYNAITIQARGVAGSEYIDGLAKPLLDAISAKRKLFTGEISKEVAQNQLETAQVKASLPFMQDPDMARAVAGSKLFNGVLNPAILAGMGSRVVEFLTKNATPRAVPSNLTSDSPNDKAQAKVYLDGVKDNIHNLTNKNPAIQDPKGTFEELKSHVNQIVKGVNSFANAQENPAQLNEVVDFFASDEFLQYQRLGGTIDASNIDGAKNAVAINYGDKLIPAVRDEWERSKTTVGYPQSVQQIGPVTIPKANTESTTQAIQYQWTGKSINFKPSPGMEKNRGAIAKARELQQRLAPLINRSVRMAAHFEGSDDYTKYFQANEELFFGAKEDKPSGK